VIFLIEKAVQEPSSKKGTLMLKLELTVASSGELHGRKAFQQYVIDPNAKEGSRRRLKQLIVASGVPLDQTGGFDDAHLLGRHIMADVENEPYTETDPVTGSVVQKSSTRIINERIPQQAGAAPQVPAGYAQPPMAAVAPQGQFAPPPAAYAAPTGAPMYPPPGNSFPPAVPRGAPGVTPVAR
jgi:hypothetical protein